jgi:hypothetical protein
MEQQFFLAFIIILIIFFIIIIFSYMSKPAKTGEGLSNLIVKPAKNPADSYALRINDCGKIDSPMYNDDYNPKEMIASLKQLKSAIDYVDLDNLYPSSHPRRSLEGFDPENMYNQSTKLSKKPNKQRKEEMTENEAIKKEVNAIFLNKTHGDGDKHVANMGITKGRKAQNSIINRASYNINSFRPFVSEELNDNMNRDWYEDFGDLEQLM